MGTLGLRTARRAKVPGNLLASGGQLSYTPSIECSYSWLNIYAKLHFLILNYIVLM